MSALPHLSRFLTDAVYLNQPDPVFSVFHQFVEVHLSTEVCVAGTSCLRPLLLLLDG